MKKLYYFFWFFVIVLVISVISLLSPTDFNVVYKEIIEEIKAVPNGEYITEVDISCGKSLVTYVMVDVDPENLSNEDMLKLSEDIKDVVDEQIYNEMEVAKNAVINPWLVNLYISFYPYPDYEFERHYNADAGIYEWTQL